MRNLTWSRLDELTLASRDADLLIQHIGVLLLEELEAFTREIAIGRRIGSSQFLEEVIVLEAAALLIGDDFPKCGRTRGKTNPEGKTDPEGKHQARRPGTSSYN